jgi:hypothetical protein
VTPTDSARALARPTQRRRHESGAGSGPDHTGAPVKSAPWVLICRSTGGVKRLRAAGSASGKSLACLRYCSCDGLKVSRSPAKLSRPAPFRTSLPPSGLQSETQRGDADQRAQCRGERQNRVGAVRLPVDLASPGDGERKEPVVHGGREQSADCVKPRLRERTPSGWRALAAAWRAKAGPSSNRSLCPLRPMRSLAD